MPTACCRGACLHRINGVASQAFASGATWLDRQLVTRDPLPLGSGGFGGEVRKAIDARVDHLAVSDQRAVVARTSQGNGGRCDFQENTRCGDVRRLGRLTFQITQGKPDAFAGKDRAADDNRLVCEINIDAQAFEYGLAWKLSQHPRLRRAGKTPDDRRMFASVVRDGEYAESLRDRSGAPENRLEPLKPWCREVIGVVLHDLAVGVAEKLHPDHHCACVDPERVRDLRFRWYAFYPQDFLAWRDLTFNENVGEARSVAQSIRNQEPAVHKCPATLLHADQAVLL
jgi:hypothetical protein